MRINKHELMTFITRAPLSRSDIDQLSIKQTYKTFEIGITDYIYFEYSQFTYLLIYDYL